MLSQERSTPVFCSGHDCASPHLEVKLAVAYSHGSTHMSTSPWQTTLLSWESYFAKWSHP